MSVTRILIVEDEMIVAQDIQKMLDGSSFEVVDIVLTGKDAVRKTGDLKPNIILMDILLQGDMDGISTVETIKSRHDIPVIYITAHSDERTLKRLKITEPDGYILKPINKRELLTSIEIALYKHEMKVKLKESRQRLEEAQSIAHMGSWEWLISEDDIIWSDETYRLFGLEPGDIRVSFDTYLSRVHPEDRDRITQEVWDALDGIKPYENRHRIIRTDKQERIHYTKARVYRDRDGNPMRLTGIIQDITEREQARERLLKSEEKYRTLFEAESDAILLIDIETETILDANKAAGTMYGYSFGELVQLNITDLTTEPEKIRDTIKSAPGTYVPLRYHKKKDGSVFPVEITVSNYELNGRKINISAIRDITERRKIEKDLMESEKNFRALAENANDGILILDEKGKYIYANNRASQITGYSVEEILEMNISQLAHPDEEDKLNVMYKKRFDEKPVPGQYETLFIKKNGETVPIELTASITTWIGKAADLLIIRDITERREAEETIKASLREKEILLKEIHHRVKNNMQVISSLLHLQSQYSSDEEVKKLFTDSQNRVLSMAMVHEKLYQSKDLSQIKISNYIRELTNQLIYSYNIDPEKISLDIVSKDIFIDINRAVPCALLINEVISNSLKHAFPGDRKGDIKIIFRKEKGRRYFLSIEDNGIGLPESFNSENLDSLGLKLVRALTEQLDGEMKLVSDNGTKFNITFPEEE